MELLEVAEELGKLTSHNKVLFVKTEPEISNFTVLQGNLLVYGQKNVLTIPLTDNITNIFYQLKETILSEGMTVIFWNMKNIMSFFHFHIPRIKNNFSSTKVIDLKLIEMFLDIKLPPPNTLQEALKRIQPYLTNDNCKNIHKNIHKPLSLQVLPKMETYRGVVDIEKGRYVYPSYEIEGQAFGRLNCSKSFDDCVVPHNIGDDAKSLLKLRENYCFVYFDFRHMEVSMLQWLSKDEKLKKAMEEYDDLYKGIYKIVYNEECDTEEKREHIKSLFLPTMFGLAGQLDLRDKFKTAWSFMMDNQDQAKKRAIVKDYFGRPRSFAEKPWGVRGFLIQSASAIFCQEKLIALHNSLENNGNLLYSIHDGYIISTSKKNLQKVVRDSANTLHKESEMCKGLKIKTTCAIGLCLNRMTIIKEKSDND